ncbi:YbaN family protein [Vibrio tritonius]|uniref:YbaN family protein n=1 Tax=Vibrio tritonius TaxID=1435069 RepID=UPI0008383747|nr:YbaN family protein [Vibrio tritonius]
MIKKWALLGVGVLAVLLGIAGIFLPLLPTTPFLLLASYCFMKSSPRCYRWLHQHKMLGPVLVTWQEQRAVSKVVKQRGAIMIALSFCFSIYIVPNLWLKVLLFVVFVILMSWFLKLPTHELVANRRENH